MPLCLCGVLKQPSRAAALKNQNETRTPKRNSRPVEALVMDMKLPVGFATDVSKAPVEVRR